MGKPVIMGRKTFSLDRQAACRPHQHRGEPRPAFAAPGVLVAPSLDVAFAAARGDALRRQVGEIVVAGGADIYAQAMPLAARIAMSISTARSKGISPAIDGRIWHEIARDNKRAKQQPAMTPLLLMSHTSARHNCAL